MGQKIAVLGASRGLGAEVAKLLGADESVSELLLISRKKNLMDGLKAELIKARPNELKIEIFQADFSRDQEQERSLQALKKFEPTQILYCAGGGPHGPYASKDWKDHLWSFQVNFLFPVRLIHWALHFAENTKKLSKMIFVGSAVAENALEPNGASYAAGKIALKSLIQNVNSSQNLIDLRLFSPGYMDTELLPKGSKPRKDHGIWSPHRVAAKLVSWLDQDDYQGHRSLSPYWSEESAVESPASQALN